MAGHSKFKNIQHRKGAQDKKRAKVFSRLGKELAVAVRGAVTLMPIRVFAPRLQPVVRQTCQKIILSVLSKKSKAAMM